jgi:hypothetical protein
MAPEIRPVLGIRLPPGSRRERRPVRGIHLAAAH